MKNCFSLLLVLGFTLPLLADDSVVKVFDPTDGGTFQVPAGNKELLDAIQTHISNKQAGKTNPTMVLQSNGINGLLDTGRSTNRMASIPVIATCPNGRCSTPPVIYPNFGQTQPTVRYLTVPQSNCPNGRCPNQR